MPDTCTRGHACCTVRIDHLHGIPPEACGPCHRHGTPGGVDARTTIASAFTGGLIVTEGGHQAHIGPDVALDLADAALDKLRAAGLAIGSIEPG